MASSGGLRRRLPVFSGRHHILAVFSLGLTVMGGCAPARPLPLAPRPVPQLERLASEPGVLLGEEIMPAAPELLGPVNYDLPLEANSWVEAEVEYLMTQRRDVIERWMERGDYYKPFVQQVFKEYGIPTDLYHLGLIESGFLPAAKSSAGAVGVWQFMSATGRELGLRIGSEVDERMDPVRSTRAAARHLRSLFRTHGDWALAAAAYNAGSGRISRGLERFGARDFWDLAQRGDLADETRHYVPRLFAMTIIHRNRERLGIGVGESTYTFAFDSVQVDYETPLDVLAALGEFSVDELASFNPHLLRGSAPAGGYWVWVPAGRGESLQQAYLASDFRKDQGVASYVVRWGDSLGRIAQRAGLTTARVRQLNPSVNFDRLMAGATIKLPASAARLASREDADADDADRPKAILASNEASVPASAATPSGTTHQVKDGDTLWDIARKYDVSVEALREANDLAGQVIRTGQRLRIPATSGKGTGGSGSEAASVEHVVKSGDTLSEIAEEYGSSVSAIRQENELGSRPIRPGQILTVPL